MKNVKKVIVFVLLFFFAFFFLYFCFNIFADEIWNYGFAYNISRGLIPYRDFNMIVTPLYSFILSIFIHLLGHHLYVMYIFNSLIITILVFIMYKKIKINVIFILPILLILYSSGYNLLSVFLMVLLLYMFDKEFKYKDFILGLIIGLFILTKQTVGFFVLLPLFILVKNKSKFCIGVIIPVLVFVIYLLNNSALYNFIDYCFLGMFNFTSNNKYLFFLPLEILVVIILLYLYKSKLVGGDMWLVLMFQIIVVPIFDTYHFFLGFLIFIYYLLLKFRINILLKVLFFTLGVVVIISLMDKPKLFSNNKSYLYGKNLVFDHNVVGFVADYYSNSLDIYDNVFLFSDFAYMSKMNNNYTLNKFDLINDGNMGYNGYKKYIDEIDNMCIDSSCLFVIDKNYVDISKGRCKSPATNQTNLDIIRYVNNNYKLFDSKYGFNFYTNE